MFFIITAKSVVGSVSSQRSTAQAALDKMREYQGIFRVEVTDEHGHTLTEPQLIRLAAEETP
jgi:hypothetical protein